MPFFKLRVAWSVHVRCSKCLPGQGPIRSEAGYKIHSQGADVQLAFICRGHDLEIATGCTAAGQKFQVRLCITPLSTATSKIVRKLRIQSVLTVPDDPIAEVLAAED